MAVFDAKSRYVKYAVVYHTTDRRGRSVVAVTPAAVPIPPRLGTHRRKQGQRLDHLAAFYLQDATAFWRIAMLNDAMLPEAISEVEHLEIPAVL